MKMVLILLFALHFFSCTNVYFVCTCEKNTNQPLLKPQTFAPQPFFPLPNWPSQIDTTNFFRFNWVEKDSTKYIIDTSILIK